MVKIIFSVYLQWECECIHLPLQVVITSVYVHGRWCGILVSSALSEHVTLSLCAMYCSRSFSTSVARGLKRNFEHRDVSGSIILGQKGGRDRERERGGGGGEGKTQGHKQQTKKTQNKLLALFPDCVALHVWMPPIITNVTQHVNLQYNSQLSTTTLQVTATQVPYLLM